MKTNRKVICSSSAVRYAETLFELNIPKETIEKTREIFSEVPQITDVLDNPTIRQEKKEQVIDKVFPREMRNFLKIVCRYRKVRLLGEIFDAYDMRADEEEQIVRAVLFYTALPSEEQKKGMESFLCRKYGAKRAYIEMKKDDSLIGGFILRVGNDEYDRSTKGRLDKIRTKINTEVSEVSSINSNEIISILKEEIENFDMMSKDSEVGTVITVGDGIASIYGIDHAMYGEIVTFENGLKGMVQDIRRNEIGCILFGSDTRISEGTKVTRTEREPEFRLETLI